MPKKTKPALSDPAASQFRKEAGARLRALRAIAGKTQEEVANALNVDQSTWSKWEKGQRDPDTFAIARFCARAKASLDLVFLGRQGSAHETLFELMKRMHPEMVRAEPTDRDRSMDKALDDYRKSTDFGLDAA